MSDYGYNMLSKQSLEILLDLVEIKLSTIIVQDKDDVREIKKLRNCRSELLMSRKMHSIRSEPAFQSMAGQESTASQSL
jgi:hypothetical protein